MNFKAFSSHSNVKEWIQQVQKACSDGANDVLNTKKYDVFVDDDALLEGQDLIDSWIKEKRLDNLLAECEIQDEVSHLPKSTSNKSANHNFQPNSLDLTRKNNDYNEINEYKEVFSIDNDLDEESAVNQIVYDMLERDVIDFAKIDDEANFNSQSKKFKDPWPKMKSRQEQVKRRASERKQAWAKEKMKRHNEKIVVEEAHKQLQLEEKEHLEKYKREENEIRKEMIKIRRIMQDEDRQQKKNHSRLIEKEERREKLVKIALEKHRKESEDRIEQEVKAKEKMRKKFMKLQLEKKWRKKNMKLLHGCFSSWYSLVANKHIKYNKALAVQEWRQKLRIWNAWRTFVLRSRRDRETRQLNEEMKERHRKEVLADRFHGQILLHRCLYAWYSWVLKTKEENKMKDQHEKRAEKMIKLLKAASSGKLWEDQKTKEIDVVKSIDGNELNENSWKPFKLENFTSNVTTTTTTFSRKRNANIHANVWPHQILQNMKKKQNAFLQNTKGASVQLVAQSTDEKIQKKTTILSENKNGSSSSFQNERSEKILKNEDNSCENKEITQKKHFPGSSSLFPMEKVHSKKAATKPLHLAMEDRAKARADRKLLLDAKKRAVEEEKLAKLKQEQEEKEREILAEKQLALQRKREEMKLAKQRELEKKRRLENMKELNKKADENHNKNLLKNYGFLPWRRLIQNREKIMKNADDFYKKNLLKTDFFKWMLHTRNECERRSQFADKMCKTSLLRLGWQSLKKYRNYLSEIDKVATDFSRAYIMKKYMKIWQDFAIEERLLCWDKENRAEELNSRRLLRMTMSYWKKLIPLLREEEKREKRRNDLRKHVLSMLPDFQTTMLSP